MSAAGGSSSSFVEGLRSLCRNPSLTAVGGRNFSFTDRGSNFPFEEAAAGRSLLFVAGGPGGVRTLCSSGVRGAGSKLCFAGAARAARALCSSGTGRGGTLAVGDSLELVSEA